LKARRYLWNPGENYHPRAWYKDVPGDQLRQEISFLQHEIYGQEVELQIDIITAFDRYTDRTKRYNLP
jgi:DNA polymerase-3 subunit epsilon